MPVVTFRDTLPDSAPIRTAARSCKLGAAVGAEEAKAAGTVVAVIAQAMIENEWELTSIPFERTAVERTGRIVAAEWQAVLMTPRRVVAAYGRLILLGRAENEHIAPAAFLGT